ncbi:Anti-sigma regulatory factor (Ser/Thr protein kinase) [Streptoalloteichus tenebrarius]|uniref:Anti-sigma regulatory factor (Ser/Thr protein kinase) n=1 Tax=Streptoalloteichus tenebrarius (strain ATCC 17920 / DSM 40477 / JCM 4838 / CBS 697.72 / NBRC 16177 / NCIMB 11028 / NRRL B-12390 / A12253. 1 / ISP 5477) TaxID=1933 RepID=A0ABT1HSK9_STRSD|nr:ATP-binding protein [Streptoalloteichus tenebrarius]MCP2258510.1 Anti-sigma regulatory factor (Ser/Thr protein kinase) [Streptoalloteichus tenebrarius]BFF04127.1 SpoIIE family protein phosphatase [Streptoalloteichus tenebrarius]
MTRPDLWVDQPGHVGPARALAVRAARAAGLPQATVDRVALAATELASNLVRHAGGGSLVAHHGPAGMELLSLDLGPGIARISESMRDGFSTAGTLGAGLGTVRRAADEFDLFSLPDAGTVVLARWRTAERLGPVVGAVGLPAPGEEVSGDAWTVVRGAGLLTVLVCDGLGHGPAAAAASRRAVALAREHPDADPLTLLGALRTGLVGTRGAAVAVAQVHHGTGRLRFVGMGNVSARLYADRTSSGRRLVSRPGIVGAGQARPPVADTVHPWGQESLLVLATDGASERWSLDDWPGLTDHDPTTVAAWVLWHANRRRDDVCVLALAGARW